MHKNEIIIGMENLQVLLDEYGFCFTQNDSWVLRYVETFWYGNEDVKCILEIAKVIKFLNLCGEGNAYEIKSTIINEETGKLKGWTEKVNFNSAGVYRILYNELVDNLVLLYDYNIFNSKIKDFEDIEDIEVGNDCMHKSEIDLMYGDLNVIPNETLDVIIREYDKRSKHKTTGNARLGRIANNIYNSLKENNGYRTATYVKQYSFIYDLFVLYGKVSDSCGKGFRGGIGREKYQNVKNWITAYKTFVQRNKQDS